MDKAIELIIQKIPAILWPFALGLSMYGLIAIVRQVYDLRHKMRKDYIDALKEFLAFREQQIEIYTNYTTELQQQLELQREASEANRKAVVNLVVENEKIKQVYRSAIFAAMWMFERERCFRDLFAMLMILGHTTDEGKRYLKKHISKIVTMINEDDNIYRQIISMDCSLEERFITCLPKAYSKMSIAQEVSYLEEIRNDLFSLPGIDRFIKSNAAVAKE